MTPYKKSAPQGLSYPPLDPRTPGRHPAVSRQTLGRLPAPGRHPAAPFHRPTPKVARNSATRKFNTAHKRCNTNGLVSKFERFTWNYVRHFSATTPTPGRHPPDTQASYPTTAHTPPKPRPHPPSLAPPQKSHVIRLPENSTPPTNVAIPTVWFQSLKGLHGIMCNISGQPPRYSDAARPTPRPRTRRPPARRPGLAHTPLHRPPQKSHVIRLPENSTPPTNVAIPTIWFQSLKGLHGIMCDISGQPPR